MGPSRTDKVAPIFAFEGYNIHILRVRNSANNLLSKRRQFFTRSYPASVFHTFTSFIRAFRFASPTASNISLAAMLDTAQMFLRICARESVRSVGWPL